VSSVKNVKRRESAGESSNQKKRRAKNGKKEGNIRYGEPVRGEGVFYGDAETKTVLKGGGSSCRPEGRVGLGFKLPSAAVKSSIFSRRGGS